MGRGRRQGCYRLGRREFGGVAAAVLEAIDRGRGRPVQWGDLNISDIAWPAIAAGLEALREQELIEYVSANSAAGRPSGLRLTTAGYGWLALDRETRGLRREPENRARLSALAES